MNDLQIFNNSEFGEVRTVLVDDEPMFCRADVCKALDRYKILACACKSETNEQAWELMKLASCLYHTQDDWVFNTLYGACAMELAWKNNLDTTEYSLHSKFNAVCEKMGIGKLSYRKCERHNFPDSWVEIDNEIVPVEMKKAKFDRKALAQLQRYIEVYKTSKGVAVGDELTVELPDNIIFVSKKEVEKNYEQINSN